MTRADDNAAMPTEPIKPTPPKRKRRWYQFSLRTLLLILTVVGLWTPLLMNIAQLVHAQREAARSISHVWNKISAPGGARFNGQPWQFPANNILKPSASPESLAPANGAE
jgi:hypothetical protein